MFNVGGEEMLVIFLLALVLLGPEKLPKAARTMGKIMSELRRYSDGFRAELKAAMDDVIETDARTEGAKLSATEQADPGVHEVRAVAEVDLPSQDPAAGATDGQPATQRPVLRAVTDPLSTDAAPEADAPRPDAATG